MSVLQGAGQPNRQVPLLPHAEKGNVCRRNYQLLVIQNPTLPIIKAIPKNTWVGRSSLGGQFYRQQFPYWLTDSVSALSNQLQNWGRGEL